jgi:hypothetical protein
MFCLRTRDSAILRVRNTALRYAGFVEHLDATVALFRCDQATPRHVQTATALSQLQA